MAVERNAAHGGHVLNASGSERPVPYPKCDPILQKNAKKCFFKTNREQLVQLAHVFNRRKTLTLCFFKGTLTTGNVIF